MIFSTQHHGHNSTSLSTSTQPDPEEIDLYPRQGQQLHLKKEHLNFK